MVSVSPRVESIQQLASGEVGEIAGAIAFRSGFQHLVFVLAQTKYHQAVSSVTEHSSSSQERTGPDARRSQRLKDAVEIRHWAFLGAAKPSSTVTPRCAAPANRSPMEMLGNRAGMNVRQKFGAHEVGEVACPITGRNFFQFAVFVLREAKKNHTVSGISSHTHVLQGRVNLLGQGRIGPTIRGEQTDAEGSAPATQMPSQETSHTRRHPTASSVHPPFIGSYRVRKPGKCAPSLPAQEGQIGRASSRERG